MAERTSVIVNRFTPTPMWTAWALASSLALHAVAYFGLGNGTPAFPPPPERQRSFVRLAVVPEPPPLPAPLPQSSPEPVPKPASVPKSKPAPKPEPLPEPAPTAAPPPTAPVADEAPPPEALSGVTLASDTGSGFAMPSGNGLVRQGALRVPASLGREPRPLAPTPSAAPSSPRVVPVKDLSARPVPPALDDALERNYPKDARTRGLGGTATVRARIDADGVVRSVSILNESQPGFAAACQRTLRGSRWSAPRDAAGKAVATEVRYKCRFLVRP